MATIKEYNVKLKSLKNTQKITKTMKMVSASKLRKAHQAQENAKLYAKNLTFLISRISTSVESTAHPLLNVRKEIKNVLIIIVTSDKGLCGAFNNNANKKVEEWITGNKHFEQKVYISCCGKKGHAFFQRTHNIDSYYEDVTGNPRFAKAREIGDDLIDGYISGKYDEIYITYNQFFSPLSQKTVIEKILPIDPAALETQDEIQTAEYIFEPDRDKMLSFLIPHYLYFKIFFALLENSAGEHGARMTAMENATKNAKELSEKYTLLRNRARQTAITTELIEIVAGAEAL